MRVVAVDCGTNSVRLLIAEVTADGLRDLDRRLEIVRLGQGVDRTGRFTPAALARTFTACDAFAGRIADLGADRVRVVATSAARDATNGPELTSGLRARFGVEPEIVSGEEEARLSYDGAVRELGDDRVDHLVVDIGGGSTELIRRDVAQSLDIGSVRLTERHLNSDPPADREVAAAVADIDHALDTVTVPLAAPMLVGVAGTVTTVAAMALDLPAYLPERIHHARLSRAWVRDVTARLLAMTVAEKAALPFMPKGREDVIAGGALVLDRVLERVAVDDLFVSEHDILDGIAWSLV